MATQQDFILIIDDDSGRREIQLTEQIYSIGKNPDSDIYLSTRYVSRRHATLMRHQREDGSLYILSNYRWRP